MTFPVSQLFYPGNLKSLGSGGSMVARLKLKGIDGRAPQRRGACGLIWLNTGKLTRSRLRKDWQTDSFFLDSKGGGAWPFLVGGVICLVNSDNERDLSLLNSEHKLNSSSKLLSCLVLFWFARAEERWERGMKFMSGMRRWVIGNCCLFSDSVHFLEGPLQVLLGGSLRQ